MATGSDQPTTLSPTPVQYRTTSTAGLSVYDALIIPDLLFFVATLIISLTDYGSFVLKNPGILEKKVLSSSLKNPSFTTLLN